MNEAIPVPDATAPSVASTTPAKDATAPADSQISVTFTKPMNGRSVAMSVDPPVTLSTPEWSADERTVVFKPQGPFNQGTRYTLKVSGRDRAGNSLAPFSWSFTASAPTARAGAAEARLRGRLEARADERLFSLFAAFNAIGYDEGLKESSSVRGAVREKLENLTLKVVEPVRRFRGDRPRPLDAYVRYVLTLGPPPGFAEQRSPDGLDGFNRVLADFYAAAGVGDLWKAHSEAHGKASGSLASEGLTPLGRVLDYLRATDLPRAKLVLIPNLLDAPGRDYLVLREDEAAFVLGWAGAIDPVALTRLTARLIIGSSPVEPDAEAQRTSPLFDLVKDAAAKQGYTRWSDVIRESLVAAVTARLSMPTQQREAFLREQYGRGLILVEHFAAELAAYERQATPLLNYLPQMLRAVNLDEQRRIFAERKR